MAAVTGADLSKTFGETTALDGVSLSVDAGEVFALVGPNGAGKTTLVRCLTGTVTPDAGSVSVLSTSPADVSAERIGLLPQDFDPPDRLTVAELLRYYAGLYDETRDVEDVLDAVGVAEVAETRYANLSGGERRRTLLGTAIINDPDVLFLDEPTTGIDPAGRRAVWELIEELAARGTTVLLTTHYMDEVERLADRVGFLADGDLLACDSPRALIDSHGGESSVVVRTAASGPIPGYDVDAIDDGFLVSDVAPDDLGDLVDALEEADIDFTSVSWREADLETAYLELAGETPGADRRQLIGESS